LSFGEFLQYTGAFTIAIMVTAAGSSYCYGQLNDIVNFEDRQKLIQWRDHCDATSLIFRPHLYAMDHAGHAVTVFTEEHGRAPFILDDFLALDALVIQNLYLYTKPEDQAMFVTIYTSHTVAIFFGFIIASI
jgi:hypothetical protein